MALFAVATLDEAIELRMHGIKAKILILGVIPIEDINKAIQHRVAITVLQNHGYHLLLKLSMMIMRKDCGCILNLIQAWDA